MYFLRLYSLDQFFHGEALLFRGLFYRVLHILSKSFLKRSENMKRSGEPDADLDDLIFDEEDGGPSER